MTFVPHVRLTMSGTLAGTGEVFSCNLSLVPQGDQWQTVIVGAIGGVAWNSDNYQDYMISNYLDDTQFLDIVNDCRAFWSDVRSQICTRARLTRVKMVVLDKDGHYVGNPKESGFSQDGGANNDPWPNQVARKITLLTNGDGGLVKGGFFLPYPAANGFDSATSGLWSTTSTNDVQASALDFIENLNNAPGFDAEGYKVVVASQGRHYPDGTVRRPPTNHTVTGVSVGRRPDVQRRRSNKMSEARPVAAFL